MNMQSPLRGRAIALRAEPVPVSSLRASVPDWGRWIAEMSRLRDDADRANFNARMTALTDLERKAERFYHAL